MTRAMLNEGAPEAHPLPPECVAFMRLMAEHAEAGRIEAEALQSLPGLRAEAARLGEEAEKAEGDALLSRVAPEAAEKAGKAAAEAREAVRLAEKRGAAARRERLRLEAAIIAARDAAGVKLREWGAEAAQPHVQGYLTALAGLYQALGALSTIKGVTGAHVVGDARSFRLPRTPTATDQAFLEVLAARLPEMDAAGDVRRALEASERMAWRSDAA